MAMFKMRPPGPNHPAARALAARDAEVTAAVAPLGSPSPIDMAAFEAALLTPSPVRNCSICRQRPATRGRECSICFDIELDLEKGHGRVREER